jgi:hypothetical protein
MDEIVAVVTDLFFAARIRSAATAASRLLRFVSSTETLPERIDGLVLVDLDAALDVPAIVREARARGAREIIVFGPHMDTERRKAAYAAGADRVLAKSRFVEVLPGIMAGGTSTASRETG